VGKMKDSGLPPALLAEVTQITKIAHDGIGQIAALAFGATPSPFVSLTGVFNALLDHLAHNNATQIAVSGQDLEQMIADTVLAVASYASNMAEATRHETRQ
jgi:hypothetical protein